MKVKIGDVVKRKPLSFYMTAEEAKAGSTRTGTVVYVHPFGHYHTVEFDTRGGPIRESFHGVEK